MARRTAEEIHELLMEHGYSIHHEETGVGFCRRRGSDKAIEGFRVVNRTYKGPGGYPIIQFPTMCMDGSPLKKQHLDATSWHNQCQIKGRGLPPVTRHRQTARRSSCR
jgi:hypothetical protein